MERQVLYDGTFILPDFSHGTSIDFVSDQIQMGSIPFTN